MSEEVHRIAVRLLAARAEESAQRRERMAVRHQEHWIAQTFIRTGRPLPADNASILPVRYAPVPSKEMISLDCLVPDALVLLSPDAPPITGDVGCKHMSLSLLHVRIQPFHEIAYAVFAGLHVVVAGHEQTRHLVSAAPPGRQETPAAMRRHGIAFPPPVRNAPCRRNGQPRLRSAPGNSSTPR